MKITGPYVSRQQSVETKHGGCQCHLVLSLQSMSDKIYQIDFFVFETCRRVAQQCLCVLTLNLRYTSLAVHRGGLGPLLPIVSLNLTQRVLNANYDEKMAMNYKY